MDDLIREKKYSTDGLMDVISGIANKEFQERIWILCLGPQVDSYDDTVCNFFLFADFVLEEPKKYGLTNSQLEMLTDFYKKFESFTDGDNGIDPHFFIDTPEWDRIIEMAKDILKAFNYTNEILSIKEPEEFKLAIKKKHGNINLKKNK